MRNPHVYEVICPNFSGSEQAKLDGIDAFEAALKLVEDELFSEALSSFESYLASFPEDRAAQFYLQHCFEHSQK